MCFIALRMASCCYVLLVLRGWLFVCFVFAAIPACLSGDGRESTLRWLGVWLLFWNVLFELEKLRSGEASDSRSRCEAARAHLARPRPGTRGPADLAYRGSSS